MGGIVRAIGLMSGTSMDGIDAALLETDGREIRAFGETCFRPYSEAERELLRRAMAQAPQLNSRVWENGVFSEAEDMVTRAHGEAIAMLREKLPQGCAPIDLIGFHGQTILHRPQAGLTIQLGDGALLAKLTGLDVVFDFRSNDVAAGGEGAPFVPVYHRALADLAGLEMPVCFVNIGGVSNVTWIGQDGELLAFDTGPGNALLDDWMARNTGAEMDRNGAAALAGSVDRAALTALLENDYFARTPPKSLDRNAFDLAPIENLSLKNGAATLVAFTVHSLLMAADHFAEPAKCWIIAGGGVQNPAIMTALGARASAPVCAATEYGWQTDFIEAQAFAFLAARHINDLPLSYPGTTGVAEPILGGRLVRG